MQAEMSSQAMVQKLSLSSALASFSDHFSPKIVGELNGQHVKLVKVLGDFVWHHHDHEDELFLVVTGHLTIEIQDQPAVELDPGEFVIIPHGIELKPFASIETSVLLFEPASTLNTGNVRSQRTVKVLQRIE